MNMDTDRQMHEREGEAQEARVDVVDVVDAVDAVDVADGHETEPRPEQPAARRTAAQVVYERLAAIEVGEAVAHDRMTVFPLFVRGSASAPRLRYRTLAEALADHTVEVTEQASATVPELVLHNTGGMMIFVLDGEEIIGGQQNRIVNASFLVGAHAIVPLPVTCVEHGRWHSTSRTFSSGESTYYSLRSEKFTQVRESLRRGARHTSDQGAVWNSVAAKAAVARTISSTGAMHEIYASRGSSLEEYRDAFPYVAGASGFAVALGGHMAGADLFDQPETAQALWPKLLRSYALDAVDSPQSEPVARERAVRLFERASGGRAETYPSLALGEDVRFDGEGVVGGCLVYAETPVHISLFRTQTASASQPGPMARASQRLQAYQRRSRPLTRAEHTEPAE